MKEILWEVLWDYTIIIGLIWIVASLITYFIFDNKKSKSINGIKLGDLFKLVCEIDENTRLYLDTETRVMYLATDEGITPILDAKGKPRKYVEFMESIKGKEDA